MLLNHAFSVKITGIEGRIPLRAAACNGDLEVNRQLLSNGCSVQTAMKRDLTAQLAAAESGNVAVFLEFLKHLACVVIAI